MYVVKQNKETLRTVLFFRADDQLIQALDQYIEQQAKVHLGRRITRSDAIREILWQALKKDH